MFLTTSQNGIRNVMTMGFHMMVQHNPPTIGAVVGPWDHSYSALRASCECVIAVPTVDLAEAVVGVGNCSGAAANKFDHFGLTPEPARDVAAPLIKECLANIECRVIDTRLVDKYNLFVLEAQRIWIDPGRTERRILNHRGDGIFAVDGDVIDMQEKMVKWRHLLD